MKTDIIFPKAISNNINKRARIKNESWFHLRLEQIIEVLRKICLENSSEQTYPGIISGSIFIIVITILILMFSISSGLLKGPGLGLGSLDYKYYTSMEIQSGETLWSIAEQYSDTWHYEDEQAYIREVMHINHLNDEEILSGQYLIIPYYSDQFN